MNIYKYTFEVMTYIEIKMPKGAHVLTVQTQKGIPCLWAIVEPGREEETRYFRCFGTGHPLDIDIASSKYIGTFQLDGGAFIGHLFEV